MLKIDQFMQDQVSGYTVRTDVTCRCRVKMEHVYNVGALTAVLAKRLAASNHKTVFILRQYEGEMYDVFVPVEDHERQFDYICLALRRIDADVNEQLENRSLLDMLEVG